MKQEAIIKINKMGQVGSIIILIVKILLSIALIVTLISIVVTLLLPQDLVSFSVNGNADIQLDLSTFGIDVDEVSDELAASENSIMYNGTKLAITDFSTAGSKVNITASGKLAKINMRTVTGILFVVLCKVIVIMYMMITAGALAKAFRFCDSPFDDKVIKKMRNFAISLIPWAVVTTFSAGALEYYLIGNQSINFSLNLNIIFIILIVFALTYIFKYGAQLQKESDETL